MQCSWKRTISVKHLQAAENAFFLAESGLSTHWSVLRSMAAVGAAEPSIVASGGRGFLLRDDGGQGLRVKFLVVPPLAHFL